MLDLLLQLPPSVFGILYYTVLLALIFLFVKTGIKSLEIRANIEEIVLTNKKEGKKYTYLKVLFYVYGYSALGLIITILLLLLYPLFKKV
jgi:hypothetical protein